MQHDHAGCDHQDLDPRYLAFFDCFNRQLFFEAHEVLEALWLETRHSADGDFFRGLIQLAAAFVHWQDQKPGPARMLLGKARAYLANYPKVHHRLDIATVLRLVDKWLRWVEPIALGRAPSGSMSPPQLQLIGSDSSHG